MTGPIVFINRNRVKEGMLENFSEHYLASVPLVEANKPGTLVQLAYISEDENEVVIIRLFPDQDALDQQLQGADSRSKVTYQYIEPTRIEIFGTPSDFAIEMMKKVAGSGIEVVIEPQFIGGFMRLAPSEAG